jgi:hypothetical protein
MSIAQDPAAFEAAQRHERRDRRPVHLAAFVCAAGGAGADAEIVDLSYDGCAIATRLPLQPKQTVSLSVLGKGAIPAEVRWAGDGKAGLSFKTGDAPKPERPRAADRIALVSEVVVRRIGQAKYRVRVLDLSPVGCKIDLIDRPRIGEKMLIKFEGIEIMEAEVCWVEDFFAGLRFDRPFHPIVFDLLTARLRG